MQKKINKLFVIILILKVEGLFKKYHQRVLSLSKQKVHGLSVKTKAFHGALPNPLVAGGHSSHSSGLVKDEDEVCPICLSDLVEGESMTLCREGCQNRLHHHCMAVCKYLPYTHLFIIFIYLLFYLFIYLYYLLNFFTFLSFFKTLKFLFMQWK